ncbi:MAG: IS110 family transposase [Polyangiaceae bacterium]|jgi:transposase
MEVLHERCAGLDVHKDTVVACARLAGTGGEVRREVRTFGTTTRGLLELSDWMTEHGCTHVAMEATGVYWKPVWHVLEGNFELVLANAAHIRNVPGRKTDINDATWIADLLAHGLIRGSFVPPTAIQHVRELTRTRKQLVREVAQHTQRIQKTLEDANIKLTGTISDVLGLTGRAILDALVAGETDPERLADLAHHRIKAPRAKLVETLRGRVTEHHRFLLKLHLGQVDALRAGIAEVDGQLGKALGEATAMAELLTTMPGIGEVVAQVIVGEIGTDMHRFPSSAHLVSWAGLCPRSDESAGKRRNTRIRHGAPWLKTTLVQAAWSAASKKNSYHRAQFQRLKARRGPKKAIVAVAASMLTAAYHMLRDGTAFQDLGADHFDRQDRSKTAQRLTRKLQQLGYVVELRPAAADQ